MMYFDQIYPLYYTLLSPSLSHELFFKTGFFPRRMGRVYNLFQNLLAEPSANGSHL
jgi:hypothetical protein